MVLVEDQVGRRRKVDRLTGDEREAAVFQTLERVLEVKSFDEVTVMDLASGAGLSRSSFYFYFASKEEVLVALLKRLVKEALEAGDEAQRRLAGETGPWWRELIAAHHEVYLRRPRIVLAAFDAQSWNPEVRRVMEEMHTYRVRRAAEVIDRVRGSREPANGLSAHQAAVVLIAMNEEVLHSSLRKDAVALDPEEALTALGVVWAQIVGA
ncbi:TetR/AcrR family transcriptional regulator [Arthrobacter sp. NPDC090010]|uniref:TetR/AcrR family transcriptional regulator n=1 Tax=Arthrobacter sp. NPDC090010 TaxID=3363942 RepID=UPI0037F5E83D